MKQVDLKSIAAKGGVIHFIAIGGIGMSAIASILKHEGFNIQGSDSSDNQNIKRLKQEGIKTYVGHSEDNLDSNVALCVQSSIIKDDNVEIQYCKKHNIPIIHRSEMLAEIMRHKFAISISGTHGKTTTTGFVASLIEGAGLEPTVINGGIINSKGTNSYYGKGKYIISEADESDNSFIALPSNVAIITNIDAEHLDFYGTYDNLKNSFFKFIDQLPDDGFGVVCTDNEEIRNMLPRWAHKEVITYGFDKTPDIKAINVKPQGFGYSFDVACSDKFANRKIEKCITNIPGAHNVSNALAAIAVGLKLSVSTEDIINGIANYTGVKRRFTITGKERGITFVDDYAHHPEEIIATLRAARNVLTDTGGKLFVVFQPHKYSRLNTLFDRFVGSFSDADMLYIADVYAASEKPIEGINNKVLVKTIQDRRAHNDVSVLESSSVLPELIKSRCKENDIVMFMGAGDITQWAYEVPKKING